MEREVRSAAVTDREARSAAVTAPLWTLSATRLTAMIRQREVTAQQVVDAHIKRIEAVNPALNAMVRERFSAARAEALEADRRVAQTPPDELPPLHGVPCSIKENFALRGMPNTSGLMSRVGQIAGDDATAVARLRAAGAIPLGVTNLSELCMWMESSNRVYGRTNNPYDRRHIVGGSSGGEGALVGAGGSPFGLGSDIGGSVRMPAFFNGVFGHKPTGGLVPGSGQHPMASGAALRYLTTGPLCRRAEDLMPLLRILAGPDGLDSGCERMQLGDPATVDLRGLTVLSIEGNGRQPVSPELIDAQRRAGAALAARGARVRTEQVPDLGHTLDIWSAMVAAAGGATFAELLGGAGPPVKAGRELLRWALRRSPHTLPAIILALIEKLPKLMPERARRAIVLGQELRQVLVAMIGEGVMLYPSYVSTAPRHHRPLWPPFNWTYTAIFNVMELPVTQVPLGLGAGGLPLGVQVAAAHGADHRTIAVAMELERALGGWVPPPGL